MTIDISRNTFDPLRDYTTVLMQQGRVQLDSDWNEANAIVDRRLRAGLLDAMGPAIVPRTTPAGFRIEITGGNQPLAQRVQVGAGRLYVDGLLVENHDSGALVFDPLLDEPRSVQPVSYDKQPWLPEPPPLPQQGRFLVYLDAWQRLITAHEEPSLIDPAIGVETTARLQTVWQVRALPVPESVSAATPVKDIPGWAELVRPSAGRLTTGTVEVPVEEDPCLLPPGAGYRGVDNRLYRVEIHDGGAPGEATFKWSRDNGTVVARVVDRSGKRKLVVDTVGLDDDLRFRVEEWVEITDEHRLLHGTPGVMAKIKAVDDDTRTIELTADLPAGVIAADAAGLAQRRTRVRRWNQAGTVLDGEGGVLGDVDGGGGVIKVPASGTVQVQLERGVAVSFSLAAPAQGQSPGVFRAGDHWIFAARSADQSVEQIVEAPPVGIHHHFARLAVVSLPSTVDDCRTLWPPESAGSACSCTVCVSPEAHREGTLTIQAALDQVISAGGGAVCLDTGTYDLGDSPLRIAKGRSVRLCGRGRATRVVATRGSSALVIDEASIETTIEDLALVASGTVSDQGAVVIVRDATRTAIRRCAVAPVDAVNATVGAIGVGGVVVGLEIEACELYGATGLGNLQPPLENAAVTLRRVTASPTFLASLHVIDNLFLSRIRGIAFDRGCVHYLETRIVGNAIGLGATGIVLAGLALDEATVEIRGNLVRCAGPCVVTGVDGTIIEANDLGGTDAASVDGVVLIPGAESRGPADCRIAGNRVRRLGGAGIRIAAEVGSVVIAGNLVSEIGGSAILMEEDASAEAIIIEGNRLRAISLADSQRPALGVSLVGADRAQISDNIIEGVGASIGGNGKRDCAGVRCVNCGHVAVSDNTLMEIGPVDAFGGEAYGIDCLGGFESVDVSGNRVGDRHGASTAADVTSSRTALRIRGTQRLDGGFAAVATAVGAATAEAAVSASLTTVAPVTGVDLHFVRIDPSRITAVGERVVISLAARSERVKVQGNRFEWRGRRHLVDVAVEGPANVDGNQCLLVTRSEAALVASIVAESAVVASNHVGRGLDLTMRVAVNGSADAVRAALVGNMIAGRAQVNGADLGSTPWTAMNVQL